VIDISATVGLPAALDPETAALTFGAGVAVEETTVRSLGAARDAYADPLPQSAPLYHMANGITPMDEADPTSKLRFELTSLRPGLIGPEWVKTIGHLHDTAPDGVGYPELYEVVAGDGLFLVFRPHEARLTLDVTSQLACTCALIAADTGDRFVIPPGWHHLAINPGQSAFVFADIVARAVRPDYSVPRTLRGAPVYFGPDGPLRNPRYPGGRLVQMAARELLLPEQASVPLQHAFARETNRLQFLLEPAQYGHTWAAFDRAVRSVPETEIASLTSAVTA
jgi:glucose-6-phosphate isomerase